MTKNFNRLVLKANRNFWGKTNYYKCIRQGLAWPLKKLPKWFSRPNKSKGYGAILICLLDKGPLHASALKTMLNIKQSSNDEVINRMVRAKLITSTKDGYKVTDFGNEYYKSWIG